MPMAPARMRVGHISAWLLAYDNHMHVLSSASRITNATRVSGSRCGENRMPTIAIEEAEAQISHVRSIRSANSIDTSGPRGLAMAMMNEYIRLWVMVTPFSTSSVGTQLAKP